MIPRVAPIRQYVASERVDDVPAQVRQGLRAIALGKYVQPGMRVAVAIGSRGIGCLTTVLRAVVDELRLLGAEPFLIPAMGSHGGGTAEGQEAVLESYGVRSAAPGIPILSSMETVRIGETPEGMAVYLDAHAARADGIIAINRIKEHTAFKGRWESGLLKILSVGLGKTTGAAEIHNWGVREAMPAAARVVLNRMQVLAGIGIIENGKHQPARIAVLPSGRIEADEPALLDLARQLLPRIPFEPVDLLILQEMGKEISGTGMDLNIVGMWRRTGGPVEPQINTIGVLNLTAASHGNALGVGHADLITQRLRDKIDLAATYKNCLTSHNLAGAKIPLTLPTDYDVMEVGLAGIEPARARLVIARNTLELDTMWVSDALLPSVAATRTLEQVGPLRPVTFGDSGRLNLPG